MKNNKRIIEFDYIRVIAMVLVVLFHFFSILGDKNPLKIFNKETFHLLNDQLSFFLRNPGMIGIALFFIVSGASLYVSYKKNKKISFLEWGKNRILTIYPKQFIVFFIIVLPGLIMGSLNLSFTEFITSLFGIQEYFGFSSELNSPTWFIGAILALYVFFWIFKDIFDSVNKNLLLIAIFISSVYLSTYSLFFVYLLDYCFIFSFAILTLDYLMKIRKKISILVLSFLLSIVSISLFTTSTSPFYSLFFIFLFCLCSFLSSFSKLNKIVLKISSLSFSIFLVHYPLLKIIDYLQVSLVSIIIYFSSVILCACLLDYFVNLLLNKYK